jgi:transcription-repair coupling factor (superfamily II helicase)
VTSSASAVHQRLSALWRLADGTPRAVVIPLRALLQHTIPPDVLAGNGVIHVLEGVVLPPL